MTIKSIKIGTVDLAVIVLIILSSLVLLLDVLIFKPQPANMDGVVHITNSAIFHKALSDGDFPVRWTDGFANYGLPMGSFAQQLTSYMGGFLTFVTHDPVIAFNIVYVVGSLASVLLFYVFLRIYFKEWPSFIGAFLFNFAPYRIMNLYIRGAIPEYFSSVFFASILLSLYYLIKKKRSWAFLTLTLSTFGMILSHPMNVITSSFFIGPYLIFLLIKEKNIFKQLLAVGSSVFFGLLLSGYYVIPLLREVKYLFYGSGSNHYIPTPPFNLENLFSPDWYYFITEKNEILSRGHFVKTGLIETLLLVTGFLISILRIIKKKSLNILAFTVLIGVITLFMTSSIALNLYLKVDILSNIQFPWRMLSTFIFVPPIIGAFLFGQIKNKKLLISLSLLLIAVVSWTRFSEIYGKNYTQFPQNYYYFTVDNLHTSNLNTIWTKNTTEYEVHRDNKVAVLEGSGELKNIQVKNSHRSFEVIGETPVRMIDYTFYFPGWKVYVDGVETEIEFQDVDNRGVITYWVPEGDHHVEIVFENTKTVLLGNLVSLISVFGFVGLVLFRKQLAKLIG